MRLEIFKILIAGVPIEVQIEQNFNNIISLISKFDKCDGPVKFKIKIYASATRFVKLSKDFKQINIAGTDVNDLTNPFNLIGVFQAIFRFAGIHSVSNNIYLIHGSASIANNQAVCFGDDGKNMAKTMSSVEYALKSKKYIGDEFCFLDLNNKKIFSYSFIPIHLRPEVKKHFLKEHNLILPFTEFQENKAGYFIEPTKLFKVFKSKKLTAFIFPHFHNGPYKLKPLNGKQKEEAVSACVSAHLLKLIYPFLDRMQFAGKTDSTQIKTQNSKKLRNALIKKLSLRNSIYQIAKTFPCYRFYIKKPCDVTQIGGLIKDRARSIQ